MLAVALLACSGCGATHETAAAGNRDASAEPAGAPPEKPAEPVEPLCERTADCATGSCLQVGCVRRCVEFPPCAAPPGPFGLVCQCDGTVASIAFNCTRPRDYAHRLLQLESCGVLELCDRNDFVGAPCDASREPEPESGALHAFQVVLSGSGLDALEGQALGVRSGDVSASAKVSSGQVELVFPVRLPLPGDTRAAPDEVFVDADLDGRCRDELRVSFFRRFDGTRDRVTVVPVPGIEPSRCPSSP